MSALLIDIGNSRIKWGLCRDGALEQCASSERGSLLSEAVKAIWQCLPVPERIMASSVVDAAYEQDLTRWCEASWGIAPEFVSVNPDAGIRLAYRQPERFGVDRWLALMGGRSEFAGALCVIDCGTALTIDLLSADDEHQGGVIVPGFRLMQQALLGNTVGIKSAFELSSGQRLSHLLGTDTVSGIEQGALNAVTGAIEHTVAKIKRNMNLPIVCIVTGGDASSVLTELVGEYQHRPHLVLQGLQALIAD